MENLVKIHSSDDEQSEGDTFRQAFRGSVKSNPALDQSANMLDEEYTFSSRNPETFGSTVVCIAVRECVFSNATGASRRIHVTRDPDCNIIYGRKEETGVQAAPTMRWWGVRKCLRGPYQA